MSVRKVLPPRASSLFHSMRDIGYSLETAIADLVDNSVTANATRIQVLCPPSANPPFLLVADDGHGMSADVLVEAMRHGGYGPASQRDSHDLGRFGLGLKTASFSQCRRLTVVTMKAGRLAGAVWDLGVVEHADEWVIEVLSEEELSGFPHVELLTAGGTVVLWENLDRLIEDTTGRSRQEVIADKLDLVRNHLSLVFHRFLSGESRLRRRLQIELNGRSLEPFDPFCRANPATQRLPEEIVHVGDTSRIVIRPFVLPHFSKLSAAETDLYRTRSDLLANQGIYVYRNDRLLAWGDWFRLAPKSESTKLARVSVDFSSDMDEAWEIDIRKARARPPHIVRERMRQIVKRLADQSTEVHRHRGAKLYASGEDPIWRRFARGGAISYEIDTEHPLVEALVEKSAAELRPPLLGLLRAIGTAVPIEAIYSDYAAEPAALHYRQFHLDDETRLDLQALIHVVNVSSAEDFLDTLRSAGIVKEPTTEFIAFVQGEFAREQHRSID